MITEKLSYKNSFLPKNSDKKHLFFDIETTGLQRKNALVYLIGCAFYTESGNWSIHQWFAENPDEEQEILKQFSCFLSDFDSVAHYNGTNFDIPFVEYRCGLYGLSSPFAAKTSLDYYPLLRPCKKLLGLRGLKQTDLEAFLGISRVSKLSGKDCIKVYRDLIKYRDSNYAVPLLEHNRDDLQGLICCQSFTAYLAILHENCTTISTKCTEKDIFAELRLPLPVPAAHTWIYDNFMFHAEGSRMSVEIQTPEGLLKNFYSNYKDYYYLPNEQTAIHKSVGAYVDKSRRQPASPETCFTTFRLTDTFKNSPDEIQTYLQHNIPIVLSLC